MLDMRPETTIDLASAGIGAADSGAVDLAGADLEAFDPVSELFDHGGVEVSPSGPGFDELPVGVMLAAGVARLDFDALPAGDRVEAVAALQRLVSHYQARLYAGVTSIYEYLEGDLDGDVEMARGATAAEIRAQLRLTRRTADVTVDLALALVTRLPALHQALLDGSVDVPRVKTIVLGTEHLSEPVARQVVERILPDAPQLTTGQVAARLRRLCVEVDPDDAAERYEHATDQRRVEMLPNPEGTAQLLASDLDPVRTAQAMTRVDRLARSLKADGEVRTMDQLRADVFLDLLCGTGDTTSTTTHITVDLETLIGLEDRAVELAGYGPVIADLARQAATGSRRWEYSIRDGVTGEMISVGTTRRRPTSATARRVRAGAATCVFPGCRMPATACDLDHIDDYAKGGPTTPDNLAPACRHDHGIKHRYGWTYRRTPDGNHEWTSRLGLHHTTGPP